jgi:predicted NBD/HSP70 family sugar kinase/biotin operon repressor
MKKATRQQTKQHNTTLVLKTIYGRDCVSRAEIARLTGLTRTTVSDIVGNLITDGLVIEDGYGESLGGKPPIQVKLVDDARQLICLDLSDDDFCGAVVNLRGEFSFRQVLPLQHRRGEQALQVVYQLIESLLPHSSAPILGIGIGTPGLVDARKGIVRQAVNRGWSDLPLKDLLSKRYQLPVFIGNDSHVAALAEYSFGENYQHPNLVLIKAGEGIGSGIVLSGQIHHGDGFSAGEIGHLLVQRNGALCTCGNHGCLETVASRRALIEKAVELGQASPGSPLAGVAGKPHPLDALAEVYKDGDPQTRDLVLEAGRYMGVAIAHLVGVLNVQRVVISGDFERFGPSLLQSAREEMHLHVLPAMADETELSFSTLGEDIVLRGASALVLAQQLSLP